MVLLPLSPPPMLQLLTRLPPEKAFPLLPLQTQGTRVPKSETNLMAKTPGSENLLTTLWADFQIIFERDPAAESRLEVLFCYPGFHALCLYRLAHRLHQYQVPFLPRFISHIARFLTGIEIHPGAVIGKGAFIDHGLGVVIGETAIIGENVLIYQGVTLGGTGKQTGKRHPTLGNQVVVGAGAKILGNLHIGDHVRIGAGSIVLQDVPADCTVVGVPGRIVSKPGKDSPLEHGRLPDPEAAVIRSLIVRIEKLEQQVQQFATTGKMPVPRLRSY